jgi:GH24 family phage-related lysozyme (muramidase)
MGQERNQYEARKLERPAKELISPVSRDVTVQLSDHKGQEVAASGVSYFCRAEAFCLSLPQTFFKFVITRTYSGTCLNVSFACSAGGQMNDYAFSGQYNGPSCAVFGTLYKGQVCGLD